MARLVPIGHPWINESRAPLYELVFPPRATDEQVVALGEARERWALSANYPVAWLVDLASLMEATARQRKLFSEHLQRFEPHDVAYNQGSALIVPNAFVRGIVTAVFWLKRPRFPNECFSTRAEAIAWAEQQLARASHPAPDQAPR
jgi:hypothetical protein